MANNLPPQGENGKFYYDPDMFDSLTNQEDSPSSFTSSPPRPTASNLVSSAPCQDAAASPATNKQRSRSHQPAQGEGGKYYCPDYWSDGDSDDETTSNKSFFGTGARQ
ncbi:hypothetical protein PG993_007548 [Apiospora rasikravindrae]|uniref:Uncharacterized protein n=1 Tax=Apiospora rasikravindrae TaxID=990691 RepID=A0ABR1SXT5_9PEZI